MTKIVVDTDEVLEPEEAAKELEISSATFWRRIYSGEILRLIIKGHTYITRGEMERLKTSKDKERQKEAA